MYASLKTLRTLPLRQALRRMAFRLGGKVITISPKGTSRGRVLISYTTLPFIDTREKALDGHSNRWECQEIVRQFVDRGYIVDVIDFDNINFMPKHKYTYCMDVDFNLERLSKRLNQDCTLIFHATAAHWLFWNAAEYSRLESIQKRRGVAILPKRASEPTRSPDVAHLISSLCGEFPESTYHFLHKEIYPIPVTSTHTFPKPEKDFDAVRKQFIWFGGAGVVRKGLDLVLEAFAGMPEYTLIVCGKYIGEEDFVAAYEKELFHTPNIKAMGYMDTSSSVFASILKESLGVVYASSAEGCATSILLAMHAGLIPIVSKETGVGTGDFGITLRENSIQSIQQAVQELASEPANKLEQRSYATWEYVRNRHTREHFSEAYASFITTLEQKYENK